METLQNLNNQRTVPGATNVARPSTNVARPSTNQNVSDADIIKRFSIKEAHNTIHFDSLKRVSTEIIGVMIADCHNYMRDCRVEEFKMSSTVLTVLIFNSRASIQKFLEIGSVRKVFINAFNRHY